MARTFDIKTTNVPVNKLTTLLQVLNERKRTGEREGERQGEENRNFCATGRGAKPRRKEFADKWRSGTEMFHRSRFSPSNYSSAESTSRYPLHPRTPSPPPINRHSSLIGISFSRQDNEVILAEPQTTPRNRRSNLTSHSRPIHRAAPRILAILFLVSFLPSETSYDGAASSGGEEAPRIAPTSRRNRGRGRLF